MKFAALMFIVGTAAAGRLENTYLPPGSAASAGGGAGFIQTPGFSSDYSAPSAGLSAGSYQGSGGNRGQVIAITQYSNQNNGDGSYQYNYETANGISASESGTQRGDGQAVSGAFSFTGTDGLQYTIHYTADENGFHPEGAHLPTPPPIPEEIRRGVELSLAAEARGENQDGQYRQEAQKFYRGQLNAGNGGYQY